MTLVLIMFTIGLCVAVKAAEAHRPGLHSPGSLKAPKLHYLISARQTTNGLARARCIPRPYRSVRPASRVPEFARPFYITVELARQAVYRLRDSECLPTTAIGIIRYVFPASTENAAIEVARCETGGTFSFYAKNPRSSASGLFQLLAIHWTAPGPVFNPFDPWANTRYAYRLSDAGTNWSAWACQP